MSDSEETSSNTKPKKKLRTGILQQPYYFPPSGYPPTFPGLIVGTSIAANAELDEIDWQERAAELERDLKACRKKLDSKTLDYETLLKEGRKEDHERIQQLEEDNRTLGTQIANLQDQLTDLKTKNETLESRVTALELIQRHDEANVKQLICGSVSFVFSMKVAAYVWQDDPEVKSELLHLRLGLQDLQDRYAMTDEQQMRWDRMCKNLKMDPKDLSKTKWRLGAVSSLQKNVAEYDDVAFVDLLLKTWRNDRRNLAHPTLLPNKRPPSPTDLKELLKKQYTNNGTRVHQYTDKIVDTLDWLHRELNQTANILEEPK